MLSLYFLLGIAIFGVLLLFANEVDRWERWN
jgi:uncharacterized iron-regulated membrane protein